MLSYVCSWLFFLCACQAKENSGQESIGSSIPIEVDVETIKIGEHVEYGSYDLKEGDQISCDLDGQTVTEISI